jgi:hypothetical protein
MAESQSAQRTARILLSHPMRRLLWEIAQHKYGWRYVSLQRGRLQVAEALERRSLIIIQRGGSDPVAVATPAGLLEITRRWPVSPYALGTYDHQPGGWTPREGVAA